MLDPVSPASLAQPSLKGLNYKIMEKETNNKNPELSIVLPCRNEEKALAACLATIKETLMKHNINGEIIVSDSSTDRSPEIAKKFKARLVKHDKVGYGRAYLEGFKVVRGKYIFLADPDGTYDFKEIPRFLSFLEQGYDFVIGNRFKRKIEKGAMPWHHRYIGNPMLSLLLRTFFRINLGDSHCGMRAITKKALKKLNLRTTGMEFASEMVIQSIKKKLKTKELPINYYKRKGPSKLKSFRDGWKHLRFMLLYSPSFLFFIPGVLLLIVGLASMIWLYFGSPDIFGIRFQYHPLFLSALLAVIGYQLIIFALFAKTYAVIHLKEKNSTVKLLYKYLTIEKVGTIGIIIMLLGIIIFAMIFLKWVNTGFGPLQEVKKSIIALTLIIMGIQTLSSSFMLSILSIKRK